METKSAGKSQRSEYRRLILSITFVFAVIIVLTLYFAWPLITGVNIILKTNQVDPFDILRGQYMTLNYEISNIPVIENAKIGDTVYTSLKETSNDTWEYKSASLDKPSSGAFIAGEIKSLSSWRGGMQVDYGIEQYFFQRDAHVPRFNQIEVKISESGSARISKLLNEGKEIEIEYPKFNLGS